ncbi:PREDICTED: uncharacterized protein LOC109192368 [Ipomoea nil]|uniref:uncharacterized protein LOC109192368 n=1 Tax=Ipomoea nil TaxID=35883 RepID=UPI000900EDB0|nr:PREDICTED: uncharacterized protein LOC109192368 [Ipomoea nil]
MIPQAPYKLLEINVISAHDLPPVSKTLRTYVVAWLDSGHKLTTKVNHNGHVNPTWNYRLAFPFDDRILDSDEGAVKFEIYNVAWLRDLPIGTATLTLNSFYPPLSAKKPAVRHAAVEIRRPSTGQVQGTLNVTVQLIHDSPPETESGSQLSVSTLNKRGGETSGEDDDDDDKIDGDQENPEPEIKRGKSVRIVSEKDDASPGDMKLKNCPSFSASYVSGMHPLPSEVAAGLKKGLYYFPGEEEEYGSSIFENWSVPGETKSKSSKTVSWRMEHKVIPMAGKDHGGAAGGSYNTKRTRLSKLQRRSSSGGGCMSCFGNAYGLRFKFICGSNSKEEKKKKKEAGRH